MKCIVEIVRRSAVILIAVSFPIFSFSQEDTSKVKEVEEPVVPDNSFVFRPTLGLGVGTFTFMGDIANSNKGFHPNVSRIGYDIRISNPLTDYLDISFYTIFGKLSSSERTATRNLNFQSEIRTGGAVLSYNFSHLLPEKRNVEPYFFLGIESFEFLSKTDLFDKYGNRYFYWSDGSIKNIDESDPNAANAMIIHRDYIYESDVRELNSDGFGKYPERSWAIPIGLGFNMHLNERWKFRLGTSMHIAFTDLVDGVTEESVGDRVGNSKNDKFLYSSFSLNYDLQRMKDKKEEEEPVLPLDELLALLGKDTVDSDDDRVVDFIDDCAWTPPGVPVDEKGCPFDKDKDLVFDFGDDEKETPGGNVVDTRGVTYTEADQEKYFVKYIDSTGATIEYLVENREITGSMSGSESTNVNGTATNMNLNYVVIIGTEEKKIAANDLHKFLGFKDFKTVESGDTVYYIVGNYKTIDEAIKRKYNLTSDGWDVAGIGTTTKTYTTDKYGNRIEVTGITTIPKDKYPKDTLGESNLPPDANAVLRVQIGAFHKKLSPSVFKDAPDLIWVTGADGITRYYSGTFTDMNAAAAHKINMITKGYEGAFIVAYKDKKRVPLNTVGATAVNPNNKENLDESKDPSRTKIDKSLIKFKVQVGAYKNDVPTEMLDVFLKVGNVTPYRDNTTGITRYLTGLYGSYDEANKVLEQINSTGVKDAFIIADFNGRIISSKEALELLNQNP